MQRKITVTPKQVFINPSTITLELTVFPAELLRTEANLDKIALSLIMSAKYALRKELADLVQKQANLIAATAGSST